MENSQKVTQKQASLTLERSGSQASMACPCLSQTIDKRPDLPVGAKTLRGNKPDSGGFTGRGDLWGWFALQERRRRQAPAREPATVCSHLRPKRNKNAERPPPARGAGVRRSSAVAPAAGTAGPRQLRPPAQPNYRALISHGNAAFRREKSFSSAPEST